MILVDDAFIMFRGSRYSHMASDNRTEAGIEELHKFATSIGLKRSWFQNKNKDHPHYDVSISVRGKAVLCGALEVDSAEFVRRCSWSKVADRLREMEFDK